MVLGSTVTATIALGHVACFGDVEAQETTPPSLIAEGTISGQDDHACAVGRDGSLWCWGNNYGGSIGDGTTTTAIAPVRIGGDIAWRSVAASGNHTCAIRVDASLWCWGSNAVGQTSSSVSQDRLVPERVGGNNDWVKVAVGGGHSCGIRRDGGLWCWGGQDYGQWRHGEGLAPPPGATPVRREGSSTWVDVAAHIYQVCGVRADGSLWCAPDGTATGAAVPHGGTDSRQGDPPYVYAFQRVGTATDWMRVTVGVRGICATRTNGTLWCSGELHPDGAVQEPKQVDGATDWTGIASAAYGFCATKQDGSLFCLGFAQRLGDERPPTTLSKITQVQRVLGVAALGGTVCIQTSDGIVSCWGSNIQGELGRGEPASYDTPRQPLAPVSGPLGAR